jgi:NAD(P)-dependent dehydrogenase (short-subunit alcohol dehydrogenase family)
LQLDVGDVGSFDAFVASVSEAPEETEERETLDCLINNGGMQIAASFDETGEAGFVDLTDVHFTGVFCLTQKLLPLLADRGSIVNVSSAMTRFSTPQQVVYSAAKGAIEVLTRSRRRGTRAARDHRQHNRSWRDGYGLQRRLLSDNEQVRRRSHRSPRSGGSAAPSSVAGTIAALLGGGNHWETGQRIGAGGGILL